MNKFLDSSWVFLMVCGSFLAGAFFSKKGMSSILCEIDWVVVGTMAGALGSFFAAFIALRIATSEARERQAERTNRARLAAHKIEQPLHDCLHEIGKISKYFRSVSQRSFDKGEASTWRNVAMNIQFPVTESDLFWLAPVPNQAAERISQGISAFNAGQIRLKRINMGLPDTHVDFLTLNIIGDLFETADNHFGFALDKIQKYLAH